MTYLNIEPCPGCGVQLPPTDGPVHRYIGASPACWAIYANLLNAGEPPLADAPLNALLVDAYAAQHPGTPSDQAIQSVAVHLLTLYGVLIRGVAPNNALWIRQRALRHKKGARHSRLQFQWLTPPAFDNSLTVADIAQAPTPIARTECVRAYIEQVWSRWATTHQPLVATWYDTFVVPDYL